MKCEGDGMMRKLLDKYGAKSNFPECYKISSIGGSFTAAVKPRQRMVRLGRSVWIMALYLCCMSFVNSSCSFLETK